MGDIKNDQNKHRVCFKRHGMRQTGINSTITLQSLRGPRWLFHTPVIPIGQTIKILKPIVTINGRSNTMFHTELQYFYASL
jgi:hypothetical protein